MREMIKEGITKGYETFWRGGDIDPAALTVEKPLANAQAISDFLATLQPKTAAKSDRRSAFATSRTVSPMTAFGGPRRAASAAKARAAPPEVLVCSARPFSP
jgi:hypothetical protein